jgi:hypothetical protein
MVDLVGDLEVLKQYVCSYNKWNPYSDETKKIPAFYWLLAFYNIKFLKYQEWDSINKPQAELTGMLSNPQVYQEYAKQKREFESKKLTKGREAIVGNKIIAEADAFYDPIKGLVDSEGNILVDRETYKNISNVNGIMVSM